MCMPSLIERTISLLMAISIDINNVGSMSQCLYAYNNPNYDDVVESGWQTAQVSTISILSFSGRIIIGKYCSRSFYPCTPN